MIDQRIVSQDLIGWFYLLHDIDVCQQDLFDKQQSNLNIITDENIERALTPTYGM